MTLVLSMAALAVGLTALLWGVSVVLQGFLYAEPADRLGLRAALGGLVLAAFLTTWTYLNTHASHRDKYGTLFEFTPATVKDVTEFEAVREMPNIKDAAGKPKQQTVKYKWVAPGQFEEAGGSPFRLSTSEYLTAAMVLPDEGGKKAKFVPERDAKGLYVRQPNEPLAFREEGGSRLITEDDFHKVTVPSPGAWAAAFGLNVLHFVLWFAVCWLVLRFSLTHALMLTAVLGLTAMLALMPLLFEKNAKPRAVAAAVTDRTT